MSQSVNTMQEIIGKQINKLIFSLLIISIGSNYTFSQGKFEIGFALSTMQYEGEISLYL
jgi:hypothetical protein